MLTPNEFLPEEDNAPTPPPPPPGSPAWKEMQEKKGGEKDQTVSMPFGDSETRAMFPNDDEEKLEVDDDPRGKKPNSPEDKDGDTLSLHIEDTRARATQVSSTREEEDGPLTITDIRTRGDILTKFFDKTRAIAPTDQQPEEAKIDDGTSKKTGHTVAVIPTVKGGDSILKDLGVEKALIREGGFIQKAMKLCEDRFRRKVIREVLEDLEKAGQEDETETPEFLSHKFLRPFHALLEHEEGLAEAMSLLQNLAGQSEQGSKSSEALKKVLAKIQGAIILGRVTKNELDQKAFFNTILKVRRNGVQIKEKLAEGIRTKEDLDSISQTLAEDISISPSEMHQMLGGRTYLSDKMRAETEAIEHQRFIEHFVRYLAQVIQVVIVQSIEEKFTNKNVTTEIEKTLRDYSARGEELVQMATQGESKNSLRKKRADAIKNRDIKFAYIFFHVARWSLQNEKQVSSFASRIRIINPDISKEEVIQILTENGEGAEKLLHSGQTMRQTKKTGTMAEMESILNDYRNLMADMPEVVEALRKAKEKEQAWKEKAKENEKKPDFWQEEVLKVI